MRAISTILLVVAVIAMPALATAQAPAMQVRLLDATGAGVSGVTIALHDASGTQDLGTQITDIHGEATFDTAPSTVRLSLRGMTASGLTIFLGETSYLDAPAILINTNIGGSLVSLVMDADGMVYVDPAALEPEGGPPATSAQLAESVSTPPLTTPVAAPSAARSAPVMPVWAIIAIGIALSALVVVFTLEWKVRP